MASGKSGPRYQSRWRAAGAIAIAVAGLMAAVAVWSSILRDTAIHAVRIVSGDVPEDVVSQTPILVCALYWIVFLVALLAALYFALLDIRYIRLQYALEQQQLFKASLGDELLSSRLEKTRKP